MHLDSLSTELLSHILSFVVDAEASEAGEIKNQKLDVWRRKVALNNYASVSSRWQAIVENHTFSTIRLESTAIDQFQEIFASKRRQLTLKILDYIIILPAYSKNRRAKFETQKEMMQNDIVFDQAVYQLFKLFELWNRGGIVCANDVSTLNKPQSLTLHLGARCPTDPFERPFKFGMDPRFRRMAESIISIPKDIANVFPITSNITNLHFGSNRKIDLRAIQRIISAVTHLEKLHVTPRELPLKQEVTRREQWNVLSLLMEQVAQSFSLRSLTLSFDADEPSNHSFDPGDMRLPGTSIDRTSMALHHLAMGPGSHVRKLQLLALAPISSRLFWPYEDSDTGLHQEQQFLSSNLEHILIECNSRTPEGTWYYTGTSEPIPLGDNELPTRTDGESNSENNSYDDNSNYNGDYSGDDGAGDDHGNVDNEGDANNDDNNDDDNIDDYYDIDDNGDEDGTGSDVDDYAASIFESNKSDNSDIADFFDERRERILNGDCPTNQWRKQIDKRTFDPLLTAMVHATLRLPRLKTLFFSMGEQLPRLQRIIVMCADAGQKIDRPDLPVETESEIAARRYKIWVGRGLHWKVSEEIEALMREWSGAGGIVQRYWWPPHTYHHRADETDGWECFSNESEDRRDWCGTESS